MVEMANEPVKPTLQLRGAALYQGLVSQQQQIDLVEELRDILGHAPLFSQKMPSGKQMSVRMSAAGSFGWFSDQLGYRYVDQHPSGMDWPEIPAAILDIWRTLVPEGRAPECCLINYYGKDSRMGMHQDKDEADFSWPVISISLGDDGLFRVGNAERSGKTESVWLKSGDVIVLGGKARLAYHGIDRIRFQSSTLLPRGGRINLTLRVVT